MTEHEDDEHIVINLEEGDLPPSAYTHRLRVGQESRGSGGVVIRIEEVAVEILGAHGRLLSMSKSAYYTEHPEDEIYFNACIFSGRRLGPLGRRKARQIWFGDLNLTLEAAKLQELADRIGPIVVTPESPYRFEGLPRWPAKLHKIKRIRIVRPSKR
ncbi:MAG: hypothetical protein WBM00_07135 [Solirubrobacterales bacterium]